MIPVQPKVWVLVQDVNNLKSWDQNLTDRRKVQLTR
jgi:hypothetical protein